MTVLRCCLQDIYVKMHLLCQPESQSAVVEGSGYPVITKMPTKSKLINIRIWILAGNQLYTQEMMKHNKIREKHEQRTKQEQSQEKLD